MIRILSALAAIFFLTPPILAQPSNLDDPFQVVASKIITVSTHLGDGRIKDLRGVRFVINSYWAHSENDRKAFADSIIADPAKFTDDIAILNLMANADMLMLAVDFYKRSQDELLQKIIYFKDTRRRGWEQLIPDKPPA